MRNYPPTVIVVHPRERRSKCSVEPLRGHNDFIFRAFPEANREPLDGYVRLGIGGPVLTDADADRGLLVLDGTWRLAARMDPFYEDIPARTLPDFKTAYPRKSRLFEEPKAGLATIEAIYAACRILGRPTDGLLDRYHWRTDFLEFNGFGDSRSSRRGP